MPDKRTPLPETLPEELTPPPQETYAGLRLPDTGIHRSIERGLLARQNIILPPEPSNSYLAELAARLAPFFNHGGIMTPKELIEAIAEARKQGLHDVAEELRQQLRERSGSKAAEGPAPKMETYRPAAEDGAPIARTLDDEIGVAPGDAKDIPKRSKREITKAAAYFDEGIRQLQDDYQELVDSFDGNVADLDSEGHT